MLENTICINQVKLKIKHISMFDRSRPLDYKRKSLQLEIQTKYKKRLLSNLKRKKRSKS